MHASHMLWSRLDSRENHNPHLSPIVIRLYEASHTNFSERPFQELGCIALGRGPSPWLGGCGWR